MILAIETSGAICGVALHNGTEIVALREDDRPRIHDAVLVDQVKGVLADAGVSADALTAVACSIGPGSFTGLRIGLSVAKGLCFSLGIPLVAVPTLDSLAFAARDVATLHECDRIIVALTAEGEKCYVGMFDAFGARLEEHRTLLRGALPEVGANMLVIGTAALYFTSRGAGPENGISLPRVRYTAELGATMLARGMADNPAHTEPLYVTTVVHTPQ